MPLDEAMLGGAVHHAHTCKVRICLQWTQTGDRMQCSFECGASRMVCGGGQRQDELLYHMWCAGMDREDAVQCHVWCGRVDLDGM